MIKKKSSLNIIQQKKGGSMASMALKAASSAKQFSDPKHMEKLKQFATNGVQQFSDPKHIEQLKQFATKTISNISNSKSNNQHSNKPSNNQKIAQQPYNQQRTQPSYNSHINENIKQSVTNVMTNSNIKSKLNKSIVPNITTLNNEQLQKLKHLMLSKEIQYLENGIQITKRIINAINNELKNKNRIPQKTESKLNTYSKSNNNK